MLTWRLLQASRMATPSIVAAPASISDSHCRARAIAMTSLTRVSERTGRTCDRDRPPGSSSSSQSRAHGSGCPRSKPDRYRRRHRRTRSLQQAPRPYDLAGLPRAKPRQGHCRWSAAARNRCRPPVRRAGRVSIRCWESRTEAALALHNRSLAGSSPASSTTQSCTIPVSWRARNSL
jgi:hypothetical protein